MRAPGSPISVNFSRLRENLTFERCDGVLRILGANDGNVYLGCVEAASTFARLAGSEDCALISLQQLDSDIFGGAHEGDSDAGTDRARTIDDVGTATPELCDGLVHVIDAEAEVVEAQVRLSRLG